MAVPIPSLSDSGSALSGQITQSFGGISGSPLRARNGFDVPTIATVGVIALLALLLATKFGRR